MGVVAPRTRSRSGLGIAAFVSVAVLISIVIWFAVKPPSVHGDSAVLVRGAAVTSYCLKHGAFVDCDEYFAEHPTADSTIGVAAFPLFQYLPAIPLRAMHVSLESTLRVLVWLNALSLVFIVGLSYLILRRHTPALWAPLITVALIASPLLWYGRVAFGEELAAALILAVVAAALADVRPAVLLVLVVLASITKETNPPFVFLLAATCVLARDAASNTTRRNRLIAILAGAAIGILLNAGFNLFRYGTPRNTDYIRSVLYVPNAPLFGRVFLSEWFAPNAGLVFFWPLAPLFIFTIAFFALRARGVGARERIGAQVVALLFLGQLLLLAAWWAPFGWIAWGPRLVIPMVPAMLVAAVVLGARWATEPIGRFVRSAWLVPVAFVVTAIGVAQAVALNYGLAITKFFGPRLPRCEDAHITDHPTRYYDCLQRTAWTKRPYMLQLGWHGLNGALGWVAGIAFVTAVVTLLALARKSGRVEEPGQGARVLEPVPGAARPTLTRSEGGTDGSKASRVQDPMGS